MHVLPTLPDSTYASLAQHHELLRADNIAPRRRSRSRHSRGMLRRLLRHT